jgi:hypothetical protein
MTQDHPDAGIDAGVDLNCPGDPQCQDQPVGAVCGESIGRSCGTAPDGEPAFCYHIGNQCGRHATPEGVGVCGHTANFGAAACSDPSIPLLGCDGVIYPNLCTLERVGHQSVYGHTTAGCPPFPDACDEPPPWSLAEVWCYAYAYCNNHPVRTCVTSPTGYKQIVCDDGS